MTANRRLDQINQRAQNLGLPKKYFQKMVYLESFLKQVSQSTYRDDFILKGGFEVQALLGVESRVTEDLDSTLTGHNLDKETVSSVLQDIFKQNPDEPVQFSLRTIKDEMLGHEYPGMRVSIDLNMEGVKDNIKIDLSTGDPIVPGPVKIRQKMLMTGEPGFEMKAYPTEQIVADKMVALARLGGVNTRGKDLFDLYAIRTTLPKLNRTNLSLGFLQKSKADKLTVKPGELLTRIDELSQEMPIKRAWKVYQERSDYAKDIPFEDTIKAAKGYAKDILVGMQMLRQREQKRYLDR
jgi:predicted nucleotidyltransferase component of viral defense system